MQDPSAPNIDDIASNGEVEMQTLLSILGTRCFTIIEGQRSELGHGELNICAVDDNTLLLYIPNTFQYAITKQFPSLRATKHSFVFPGHNGMCFGVVFPISTPLDDIDMFEGLLNEYSQYQIDEEFQNDLKQNNNTNIQDDEKKPTKTKDEKYEEKGKKMAQYIEKGTLLAKK
eukprot:786355_1